MSHHRPARLEDAVLTRRELLCRSGMGFGALALGSLMAEAGLLGRPARGRRVGATPAGRRRRSRSTRSCPRPPPLRARAKRVIHLFMNGGPSHVDTFDPKPMLDEVPRQAAARRTCPPSARPARRSRSPFKFQKYGQSGIEVSELFAHTGRDASTTSA